MESIPEIILCVPGREPFWVKDIPAIAQKLGWGRAPRAVPTDKHLDPATSALVTPATIPQLPSMLVGGFLPVVNKTTLMLGFPKQELRPLLLDLLLHMSLQNDQVAASLLHTLCESLRSELGVEGVNQPDLREQLDRVQKLSQILNLGLAE